MCSPHPSWRHAPPSRFPPVDEPRCIFRNQTPLGPRRERSIDAVFSSPLLPQGRWHCPARCRPQPCFPSGLAGTVAAPTRSAPCSGANFRRLSHSWRRTFTHSGVENPTTIQTRSPKTSYVSPAIPHGPSSRRSVCRWAPSISIRYARPAACFTACRSTGVLSCSTRASVR